MRRGGEEVVDLRQASPGSDERIIVLVGGRERNLMRHLNRSHLLRVSGEVERGSKWNLLKGGGELVFVDLCPFLDRLRRGRVEGEIGCFILRLHLERNDSFPIPIPVPVCFPGSRSACSV